MGRLREAEQRSDPPFFVVVLAVCPVARCVMCGGTARALGAPASTVLQVTDVATGTTAKPGGKHPDPDSIACTNPVPMHPIFS